MEQKFTVVAQDPTNNNGQFTRTFFANSEEGVEAEVNLLFGTQNIISIELDNSPCGFDLWREGKRPLAPDFDIDLYKLYMAADNRNKARLAGAFPLDFVGTTFNN